MRFLSNLFLIIVIIIICQNSYAANNSVKIDTNHGTVNIKFNALSDETKKLIFARTISDEIIRVGNREESKGSYESAKMLYQAARDISPENKVAITKFYQTIAKIGNTNNNREHAYRQLMNAAQNIVSRFVPMEDRSEDELFLYSLARSLYPVNSQQYQQANANCQQIMDVISRNAVNKLVRNRIESSLRDVADESYHKKDYIEAISRYATLYSNLGVFYSLTKITEIIEIIDSES